MSKSTLTVRSIISNITRKPAVLFELGDKAFQLSIPEALDHANRIVNVCSGAYADGFIVDFLMSDKFGLTLDHAVAILSEFREYRAKIAYEGLLPDAPEIKPGSTPGPPTPNTGSKR